MYVAKNKLVNRKTKRTFGVGDRVVKGDFSSKAISHWLSTGELELASKKKLDRTVAGHEDLESESNQKEVDDGESRKE